MSTDSLQAIVEIMAVLRAEADHLRELAATDSGDPVYVTAAEQVAAVADALERHAAPAAAPRAAPPEDRSGTPTEPSPG